MKRRIGLCAAAGAVLLLTTAANAAISVPLTVAERAGVTRTGEIAAGGVPLPRGAVNDTKAFGVVDTSGKAVPAQFTVLNRWPSDGSVRWMLVEFPVSIAAGKTATFTLKEGAANPPPAHPMVVTKDNGRTAVKGGGVNYLLDKSDLFNFVVRTSAGGTYTTTNDPEGTVRIEDAGPLRVAVRWDGHHKNKKGEPLFAYCIRAHLYADNHVRIQYVFTHDRGPFSNDAVEIKSLSLTVPAFKGGPMTAAFGGSDAADGAGLAAGKTARQAFTGSKPRGPEYGWCSLAKGDAAVAAAVRWCWQLYPKAFTLNGDGTIRIEIVPPDAKEPVHIYRGMSKTHDILVAKGTPATVQNAAKGFQQPLFVKCPASWYCEDTLGFGRLLSVGSKHLDAKYADFDRKVAEGFEKQVNRIRDLRSKVVDRKRGVDSYGIIHFGDGFHHRAGAGHRGLEWDNCYYSYTHMLAMQFARGGSDVIFDTLREAATFEGDVGIGWITLDRAGPRQNPGKYHVGGFGGFNNHTSGSWSFYKPIGMMEAFYLTGDRRFQDMGLANFNWTLKADGFDLYHNPRSVGAGLRALIHGYLATGNKDFLYVARDVARKSERFYRVHGHFAPVRNSIFMCPNALSGLCTYQEFTGDPHLAKVLPDIVKAHFDRFGRRPNRTDYAYANLYTARLAGNKALRTSVEEAMATEGRFGGIRGGNHAIKDFAASKRDVPLIFWQLSDLAAHSVKPWGVVDLGPERADRVEVGPMPAPKRDGRLAPGEWDKAAVIDLVANPSINHKPKAGTRLRVGHDDKNLYLAVEAAEPRLDLLKVDVKEDGGRTYSDDCVEVFVSPGHRRFCVKLMLNAIGARKTSMRGHYRKELALPAEADFPIAAGKTKDAWVLEVTIPFAKIGVKTAEPGTVLGFNVIRYRVGRGPEKPGESSTWHGTSNQPESIGTLVLGK